MDPDTMMSSSDLDQAANNPRKRTNNITNNDISTSSGRAEKKARLTPPTEAQDQSLPLKPEFRKAKEQALFAKLSISLDDVEKWPSYTSSVPAESPIFTTFRETWRNDELMGCQILGFYESMDEANHKVIASWDPGWTKMDGRTAHWTKEDGAIWWQREESGGDMIQVHASEWNCRYHGAGYGH